MNAERLQKMLQKQAECERMLREKEERRKAREDEARKERAEEVRTACADLIRNNKAFKKEDKLLGGYRGADGASHFAVKRSDYEVRVKNTQEMEKPKAEKSPLSGSLWTRTSLGWMRVETIIQNGDAYRQPCTLESLPLWLYEELDIAYGLRRVSSADFVTACVLLEQIFKQYIGKEETNSSVKKRILLDIQLAITRLRKNPACVSRERALETAVEIMDRLEKQVAHMFPEPLSPLLPASNTTSPDTTEPDMPNICDYLPEEVVLHIFSFLFNPKDLCIAGTVCASWSAMANDNTLFNHFIIHLCKSLKIIPPESELPKKELFIQLWTRKVGTPNSGMSQCDRCRELFWVGKKCFCPGLRRHGSKYHKGNPVNSANLVPALLKRVQHY